jgi:D-alanyl-D-alanine-carboxypeptidase/D-alanyl-D-alanine-endopeptidase
MMRVRTNAVALAVLMFASLAAQEARIPDDTAIAAILAQRIDADKRNVGIVVGVVQPDGRRIVSHGTFGAADARRVDVDTVFEIGSISKVFTSLLLADMVERGEVKLDDPVAKFLPSTVRVPDRDGRSITLQDLSTHTSALPRLPPDFIVTDPDNPYAGYTVARLYESLGRITLPRAIGSQFEYSNLGAGLLGHALALRAGSDYETVVRTRILAPLKMTDTAITLTADQRSRLARGHNQRRDAVGNWDMASLAGAGAWRSTTRDMMRLLDAFVATEPHALSAAVGRMRSVERPAMGAMSMGLGWQILKGAGGEIVSHGGMTGGYAAFVGFMPARRTGVVVLSNMLASATGVDDIGLHLLDPTRPLDRLPSSRTRVTLPAEALTPLVGRYELRPGFVATVTQEGGRLFVQPANQPRHEVFAEGPRAFFATIVDAQFLFDVDASGRAIAMTLQQGGGRLTGTRLADDAVVVPPPKRPRITLAPEALQPYVGRYQLNAAMSIVVTRDEARLFAQATGQGRFELFAESVDKFFAEVGGIEIAFDRDAGGRIPSFVIRQGGAAMLLKRVE